MKRLLSTVAVAAISTGAIAADLPSRKAPPAYVEPIPLLTWTGGYVGATLGGAFGTSSTNVSTAGASNCGLVPVTAVEESGKWDFVKKPYPKPKPDDHVAPSLGSVGCGFGYAAPAAEASNDTKSVKPVLQPQLVGTVPAGYDPQNAMIAAVGSANANLSNSRAGFIGGLGAGYNWQMGNVVIGGEADISGIAGGRGSASRTGVASDGLFSYTSRVTASSGIDWIGTVRGRLGYLVTPSLLVFGTGGLAVGGVHSSINVAGVGSGPNGEAWVGNGTRNDTRVGWTAGGGAEWRFAPHWSTKIEYLYVDLGSVSYSVPVVGSNWIGASNVKTKFDTNIVRVGLNYSFN